MNARMQFLLLFACLSAVVASAQTGRNGQARDAKTKEAVPFVTVRFGENGQGMVAGLDGTFVLPADESGFEQITISCLGYRPLTIHKPFNDLIIYLQPDDHFLDGVVVKPPYDKIRRILGNAIRNKGSNNPDKYDWYRCHVYYKMIADATLPDTILKDTGRDSRETKEFLDKQHLLISETYSIRTWRAPQQLQEDVLATRFSGLTRTAFTSLVTDVLPFHGYNDYITLNGKDYHNPVSRGFEQYYRFGLVDEVIQGPDTVWALSFQPKGLRANNLTGVVYINSDGYAIARLVARAKDSLLKMTVRVEQQYERVPLNDSETRWFPHQLNYAIDWGQKSGDVDLTLRMKGNSKIDSVTFNKDEQFRFDKSHTVRLSKGSDGKDEQSWSRLRPLALTDKEQMTYSFADSVGKEFHFDRYMGYLSKLPDGKIPVGPLDIELKRLFSYNKYEQVRLGLGVQTNEKIVKWLSVGGWAGYGFGDEEWKYSGFAEAYAGRYKEFVVRASYTNDISEPGRIHLDHDIDRNYLKSYLLNRVDNVVSTTLSVRKKLGYWNVGLTASHQEITPKYLYMLNYHGSNIATFSANEASIRFRYAFGERTTPFFGYYTRAGCRYPILYGKVTVGNVRDTGNMMSTPYTQAVLAVQWHKHINRLGFEHILVEAGKSWSNDPLPLNKLFAGNGFKYDSKSGSLYAFGGMLTMYPYDYYTDQFVTLIFRHDFDRKLYRLEAHDLPYSSAPNICLQYDMLCGSLDRPEAQRYVNFRVPAGGYHEAGLLLNSLFRLRYLNLYYITLNVGYFYHFSNTWNDKDGRLVIGLGAEL